MGHRVAVGVIGDSDLPRPTHPATNAAVEHAAAAVGVSADIRWLATPALEEMADAELATFDGLLGAPGSPYRSLDGALEGIRYARVNGLPYLGTCGGFQHAVLEYVRGALGVANARHGEYEPDAPDPLIAPLSCSVAGRTLEVELDRDSRVGAAYANDRASEEFRCSYGIAGYGRSLIARSDLRVVGRDATGEPRVVELTNHPFFVAALYVPQLRSSPDAPHPLLTAFVRATLGQPVGRTDATALPA
jgi:CTP synthase (UTP-ammonia lyase)